MFDRTNPRGFFFFNNSTAFLLIDWLCWVFVGARGLSLVVASWGHSSSRCAGLSLTQASLVGGAQAPDAQAQ